MGSPNNIDVVIGNAKIRIGKISTAEWCSIIEAALRKIGPCLKYASGFKTLAKLLNDKLLTHGRFVTPTNAMPKFEGTGLNQKTRFVALDMWKSAKNANAESSHEIKQNILLLTDAGHFAILKISCFRQTDYFTVCASSLIATSSTAGYKSVLEADCQEMRDCIDSKFISPYNVLDRLYLLFYNSVADGEKYLNSKREARDMLKQMCDRIAI